MTICNTLLHLFPFQFGSEKDKKKTKMRATHCYYVYRLLKSCTVLLLKIQSTKAKVNTSPPKIYGHILAKRKKRMVREIIYCLIIV